MKDYEVLELNNSEIRCLLVIMCNSNSPYVYLPQILEKMQDKKETIIVDQILHVGNTEKRFLTLNLDQKDYSIISIPKTSNIRKASCEYLRNADYIDYTILSSVQKRMIKKGIAI